MTWTTLGREARRNRAIPATEGSIRIARTGNDSNSSTPVWSSTVSSRSPRAIAST
jgi:hypothetical protein